MNEFMKGINTKDYEWQELHANQNIDRKYVRNLRFCPEIVALFFTV